MSETGTVRAGFIPIGQPLDSSGAGEGNQGIKHGNGEIHHLGIIYDDMLMLERAHFIPYSPIFLGIDSCLKIHYCITVMFIINV